jgi:pimeloyl-ACP methyl ester carboxylesterase
MSISESLGELKEVRLAQGTLRYRERGTGEPMVFVHGVFVNGDLWRKIVPGLAGTYRCIAVDLPLGGHDLPMNADADLSPPRVADLLADFIQALGLTNVTLVANDTGGAICQMMITTRPEGIARLVLTNCDAFSEFPPLLLKPLPMLSRVPGFMFLMGKLMNTAPARAALMWAVSKKGIEREIQRSFLEQAASNGAVRRDLRKFLRASTPKQTQAAARLLPGFERPVLIAWAPKDIFFSKKSAERLARTLPDARLEWIKDSLLFVPEDQPELLAELIERFVAGTAAGPTTHPASSMRASEQRLEVNG